jgi:hypothetical protein
MVTCQELRHLCRSLKTNTTWALAHNTLNIWAKAHIVLLFFSGINAGAIEFNQ